MKKFIFLIVLTIFLHDGLAYAAIMYSECEYVMGDNDTKADAKQLCLLEAKRKLLDEVGTHVESKTEVLNYNLTKDEIRAYTAGIIRIEIVSEKIHLMGRALSSK